MLKQLAKTSSILITGGAGFIGTRLIDRLSLAGIEKIFVLDNFLEQVHGNNRPTFSSVVTCEVGDIADEGLVRRFVRDADPDVIFHMAADTGTGQSMDLPRRYCTTNITGTAILLEALKAISMPDKSRHIVLPSSRAVYGEGAYSLENGTIAPGPNRSPADLATGKFDIAEIRGLRAEPIKTPEETPPNPASVYGSTKLMQEYLVAQLAPVSGLSATILRLQNVYGPGQSLSNPYTGIISNFIETVRQGNRINIFEDGKISRDFIHVEDVVSALVAAASVKEYPNPINIGSGQATSIIELSSILLRVLGAPPHDFFISGQFRAGDIRHAVADIRRAREILSWSPSIGLEEGLRSVVDWSTQKTSN